MEGPAPILEAGTMEQRLCAPLPIGQGQSSPRRGCLQLFVEQHEPTLETLQLPTAQNQDLLEQATMSLNIPNAPNAGLFKGGYNKCGRDSGNGIRLRVSCPRRKVEVSAFFFRQRENKCRNEAKVKPERIQSEPRGAAKGRIQ